MKKSMIALSLAIVNSMGQDNYARMMHGEGFYRKHYPLPGAKASGAAAQKRTAQKRRNKKK